MRERVINEIVFETYQRCPSGGVVLTFFLGSVPDFSLVRLDKTRLIGARQRDSSRNERCALITVTYTWMKPNWPSFFHYFAKVPSFGPSLRSPLPCASCVHFVGGILLSRNSLTTIGRTHTKYLTFSILSEAGNPTLRELVSDMSTRKQVTLGYVHTSFRAGLNVLTILLQKIPGQRAKRRSS
jgi:hypothetical protein